MDIHNLIVVGAGPAGLSAAINGASELPKVLLIDSGKKDEQGVRHAVLGGQALGSTKIENYAGFPEGISGPDLMKAFARQARNLGTIVACPARASKLELVDEGVKCISTREGINYFARAVILANGLSYRKFEVDGVERLRGKGVMYGAPTSNAHAFGKCTVCIVGSANSAGQAAMHFAQNPNCAVHMLVRGEGLSDQMSQYLSDRILKQPNIKVFTNVQVQKACGDNRLTGVRIAHTRGGIEEITTDHLFIFIGAAPKVEWLDGAVAMNRHKFIATGSSLGTLYGPKMNFETSMPGVFAAGDIRMDNPTKRVAAAVGEGAGAISDVHKYLSTH